MGKFKGNGLTQAVVTQNDSSILEFNTKEEIEIACHEENRKKFTQTNDTPVMYGVLEKDIGYDGTSEACKQILDGTYIPPPLALTLIL